MTKRLREAKRLHFFIFFMRRKSELREQEVELGIGTISKKRESTEIEVHSLFDTEPKESTDCI